jgi:hypothetical protein
VLPKDIFLLGTKSSFEDEIAASSFCLLTLRFPHNQPLNPLRYGAPVVACNPPPGDASKSPRPPNHMNDDCDELDKAPLSHILYWTFVGCYSESRLVMDTMPDWTGTPKAKKFQRHCTIGVSIISLIAWMIALYGAANVPWVADLYHLLNPGSAHLHRSKASKHNPTVNAIFTIFRSA